MSDESKLHECPVCHAPATVKIDAAGVTGYSVTILPEQIAIALDNEGVARRVSAIIKNELRLAIASVLLEGDPGADGFFSIKDVEDEAEAGLRSLDVAKQLAARDRHVEAGHFRGLSERHQRRALRITALLSEAEQQLVKQKVHGGPVGGQVPAHIRIVTQ